MPDLTPRQALFVTEYANGKNLRDAAIAAGYRPANADCQASKMVTKPHIAEAIERERTKVKAATLARSVYSLEGQLEKLEAIYQLAMADENYNTAVKVISEQNKMLGLLAPERKDVNVTGTVTHEFEPLSETDRWLESLVIDHEEIEDTQPRLQ